MFADEMKVQDSAEARLIGPHEGQLLELIGDVIRVVVSESATGGAFSLCEIHALPGGGPPPHTHKQLELMYVLEGEAEFFGMRDGRWQGFPAGPGCVFVATAGVPHTFAGRGDKPARFLVLVADGSLEQFFLQAGSSVASLAEIPAVRAHPSAEQLTKVMGAMQDHRIGMADPAAAWDGDSVEFHAAERSGWLSLLNEAIFPLSRGSRHNGLFAADIIKRPGLAAPLHSHGAGEILHVLEGEVTFVTAPGGELQQFTGRGGDTLFVPADVPHSFSCAGSENARVLVCILPDGPAGMEGLLDEVALPLADTAEYLGQRAGANDAARLADLSAAMRRFGMRIWQG